MAKTFESMWIDDTEYHYADIDLRNGDVAQQFTNVIGDGKVIIQNILTSNYVPDVFAEVPNHDDWLVTAAAVQELITENWYPCVSEDTLITMANGTTKPIKEVQSGEEILSYNPTTQEKCTAVVIKAYKTGETAHFQNWIFNDGKHLSTYGHHGYYDATEKRIKNIENVNPYATGRARSFFLNEDLEPHLVTTVVTDSSYENIRSRYNLISSNNLYFANGILCGHTPVDKLAYFVHRSLDKKLPENIKAIFKQDCKTYDDFNAIYKNADYLLETNEARTNFHLANRIIIRDRKALAALDYKIMKHIESALGEEEYEQVISRKATLREEINQYRPQFHENLAIIEAANLKYRNGATVQSIFEMCCDRDNAALDQFKDWLCK